MNSTDKAIEVLNSGGVILYRTDTVWGIGCKASNEKAINKVYNIKNRNIDKKLILLLGDDRRLKNYVKEIPEVAWDLIEYSNEAPTIVYPNAINLPKILIEKDNSIAIRIVKSIELKNLINKLKSPLTSTSANISGDSIPNEIKEVSKDILRKVDYILDLPKNSKNLILLTIPLLPGSKNHLHLKMRITKVFIKSFIR